uniref:Uncharacterized protein n=1 Tax=Lepeophtheirus salmonis TaxID=72036 RepID=A0A0K2TSX0_LEPSM
MKSSSPVDFIIEHTVRVKYKIQITFVMTVSAFRYHSIAFIKRWKGDSVRVLNNSSKGIPRMDEGVGISAVEFQSSYSQQSYDKLTLSC